MKINKSKLYGMAEIAIYIVVIAVLVAVAVSVFSKAF